MKSKSHSLFGRVAILSLLMTFVLVGVVFAAPITLDTFDEGAQDLTANSATPVSGTAADASILGGERDIVVTRTSGSGNVTVRVDFADDNLMSFSLASSTNGNARVIWDGSGDSPTTVQPTGLGGIDMTGGGTNDGFLFTIVSNDLTANMRLRVYSSATSYSDRTVRLPGGIFSGDSVDLFVPFGDFSLGTGASTVANFANVGAVELLVNSTSVATLDVSIDLFEARSAREFGDLPDTYDTLLTSDGARHVPQGLRLGFNLDVEDDGLPSTDAVDDDDDDTLDDEDGVVRAPIPWFVGAAGGSVEVTVQGCLDDGFCYLNGWIDWNNDGDFADTDEQIFTNVLRANSVGSTLTFAIPTGVFFPNTFYARFRICDTNNADPDNTNCHTSDGSTVNGEVEDYQWSFNPSAVALNSASTGLANSGGPLVAALVIGGLLIATGVVVTRRKR